MAVGRTIEGIHVLDRPRREAIGDQQPGGAEGSSVIAYIHGAMDRSAAFLRVMRYLPDQDHIALDRRGYSRSVSRGTASAFHQHVDDLFSVLEGREAIVVGHSAGGAVALAAAQARPDQIRAGVVFESPRPWAPWWPQPKRSIHDMTDREAVERFMIDVAGEGVWAEMAPAIQEKRYLEGEALRADIVQMESELYDATKIRVPVVAGYGSLGVDRHRRATEELVEDLPLGELAVIQGAQHGAHMSHPRPFSDLVRRAIELSGDESRR